jgi:hypothetical protein
MAEFSAASKMSFAAAVNYSGLGYICLNFRPLQNGFGSRSKIKQFAT